LKRSTINFHTKAPYSFLRASLRQAKSRATARLWR